MAEVAFAVSLGTALTIETAKALTKLVSKRAREETTLVWGSKDQYEKLGRKFELVGALLDDLGRSNPVQRSALVDIWLTRVKNAFYMADNVMDEYAYENVRRKLERNLNPSIGRKMSIYFSLSSSDIFFRFKMSLKVREIIALFDEIDKEAKDIGLNPMDFVRDEVYGRYNSQDSGADGWNRARKFASYSNGFIGRENDEEILLEMLCNPGKNMGDGGNLSTVAIVGMGGIGKTTLARRLYDHEKISAHFANKKYWICVSENFDITRLLNEMLESVTSEKQELSNTDTIIRKLQKDMKGDRILLVLDDVWNGNKELWDSLKGSLQRIEPLPGSVILITTRRHEVAENAGVASPHLLRELSSDESWALLKQNGFISRNSLNNPLQEEVGRRILEKCNGVPLAIKVVGGLLKSREHVYEWESIEKSELWNLPEGLNHILPSLMLSFNHLPSLSLKQCFAYLSIFPRNCYMYKSELVGVWSSQGYLCDYKAQNRTLAEIGEDYLKVLLNSSLLQSNEVDGGKFVRYNMHDLVYDLAVYVSGNELIKEVKNLHEKGSCRHLVFSCGENNTKFDFPAEQVFRKLRTISLSSGKFVPWNMLIQARHLRTLFLDETGIKELPPAIGLLKYLRYLDLSRNPIKTLPDSIGKLYQLQTIILLDCKYMTKLPKVLNSLVNLRYIWTKTPMFAWNGLGQLTNLQALPCLGLEADDKGWAIDELGKLHELKDEIDIRGLECVNGKEEARKAGLADKVRVSRLSLAWSEGREQSSEGIISDRDVLDGLEPHPNITSLKVQNFKAENFPTWITNMAVLSKERKDSWTRLNNLTVVKLLNCSRCQTLPTLGQLPLLKCLIVSGLDVKCIGNMFYDYEDVHKRALLSFQSLREFEISKFQVLTEWMEPPQEAFPCLEILRVRDCYLLESVPVIGIKSLKSLELRNLHCVNSLDIVKYNTGLTSLIMNVLPKITSLPQELANCRKLEKLWLKDLPELVSFPSKLESLVSLQSLQVRNCPALNFLPDDFLHDLSSLREIFLYDCPSLSNIPTSLEGCTSLVSLTVLKCPMIKDPPTNFSKLLHLSELFITYHPANHLMSLLNAVQHLPQLRCLGIGGFRDEEEMTDYFSDVTPFNSLASLTTLVLSGRPKIKILPQQLGSLTRIVALFIWKFEDLEQIPDWICNISSLEVLFLEFCKNLKCLPSKGVLQRLPRLRYLRIADCPLLSERYGKDYGPEWHNISHVECIEIDHKEVQDLHE